jgi:hypothetical protein
MIDGFWPGTCAGVGIVLAILGVVLLYLTRPGSRTLDPEDRTHRYIDQRCQQLTEKIAQLRLRIAKLETRAIENPTLACPLCQSAKIVGSQTPHHAFCEDCAYTWRLEDRHE